jgi:hypothetical protein
LEDDIMAMKLEDLVTRFMKDAKFRDGLEKEPWNALESVGIKATPELVQSLQSLDWASIHKVNENYKTAAGIST